ncbi:MAG: 4-hydroxythreonine-4-phosphate dehydrogenase PdxA [Candidatus Omnitrophica bacterium]|nr:4-hydroxythreonine-4-phosphate dehydrogenase PdxA [Candidatus Omnitrophota bacterium]
MKSKRNPILKSHPIKVGITFGDPSGIGPSIIVKALARLRNLASLVVIGDRGIFDKAGAKAISGENYKFLDLNNVRHKDFSFGRVRPEYGKASLEYLDKAMELIAGDEIDCIVTCPISKEAINLAGFALGGHTEYFAEHTGTKDFVMMLLNKYLRISLITRHIPLKEVPGNIGRDLIHKNILLTYKSLRELFLVPKPRIVVCGLNPHASDNGFIGKEENMVIKPALGKLRARLECVIDGPLPADVAISKAKDGKYDACIAMYHDQALIPLKLFKKESGVNITLGLPFIRTSPLHGTAFDIAATPAEADPGSLIEAIKLAVRCAQNQKRD